MKQCAFFDRDDVGSRYAALKDRTVLTRDETQLTEEERELRRLLLEFEAHLLECKECLGRVRENQRFRAAFEQLGELGLLTPEGVLKNQPPPRWLAVAASVLLVSTIALAASVGWLSHRANETSTIRSPQTVSSLFVLQPVSDPDRSGTEGIPHLVPAGQSFLLCVDVPEIRRNADRFELRLLGAAGKELWKDTDAPMDPAGKLMIRVPEGFLEPGEYALEVLTSVGKEGGEKIRVTFPFFLGTD